MTNVDLATLSLTGARKALANGKLSAVELVRVIFERIEQTEPAIHAFVEVYAQDAMAQAAVADRRRRLRHPGTVPLLGIPVGIKDIYDIAGKPTRCNTNLRSDCAVAHRDSEAVHLLRQAGAVLLGKTVTQELAAGVISPPARNPWDTDRIPGGSSGGSAASIAVGSCLGALGSDTGGSIRIPASVTGTVGFKPTFGRLSTKGVFPLSASLDTIGPIGRTVADAAVMYLVLAGRNQEIASFEEQLGTSHALSGARVGVLTSYFNERIQPDVGASFERSVATLRELGAEIVECEWPDARAARASALLISRVESAAVHGEAIRNTPELIGEDVRLRLEIGAMTPGDVYVRARQTREAVKHSIAALYREHQLSALIAPTTPATALPAGNPVARFPDGTEESSGVALTRYTMPWNATGQPVISVPCGFDADGLPIGLSFIGRPDEELELSMLAHAYEQATEWHRKRPNL